MESPVVPEESNHAAFLLDRYLSEGRAHKPTVHFDRETISDDTDGLRGAGKPGHDLPGTASGNVQRDPLRREWGTFGSGVTVRAGNAARLAAQSVKKKLFAFVAEKLEANLVDLVAYL